MYKSLENVIREMNRPAHSASNLVEQGGAGEEGTDEARRNYARATPGQPEEIQLGVDIVQKPHIATAMGKNIEEDYANLSTGQLRNMLRQYGKSSPQGQAIGAELRRRGLQEQEQQEMDQAFNQLFEAYIQISEDV